VKHISQEQITVKLNIKLAGWISRRTGEIVFIKIKKGAKINDLFEYFLASHDIPQKYYNEYTGWVHIFSGFSVVKNGRVIGRFSKERLEIYKEVLTESELKDGDEIKVLPSAGGG
jgi:molybdopterin converting factor small subunit